jgi:hypothetical protein
MNVNVQVDPYFKILFLHLNEGSEKRLDKSVRFLFF